MMTNKNLLKEKKLQFSIKKKLIKFTNEIRNIYIKIWIFLNLILILANQL
jgi:hypothetical protein